MLPSILDYALNIYKLQGNTSERLILNAGEKEFAAGLMRIGCTKTMPFQGLSFLPFPNYERFLQVPKSPMFIKIKEYEDEDDILKQIEHALYH